MLAIEMCKEILKWLFPNGESLFVLATALIALYVYVGSVKQRNSDKIARVKNITFALANEILLNIDQLFTEKPENPLHYDTITEVRRNFIAEIKNQDLLEEIQKLYSKFEYYSTFVANRYATDSVGTVQRQADLQIKVLEYFGINGAYGSAPTQHPESLRDGILIPNKVKHYSRWKKVINKKVEALFRGL